MNWNDRAVPAHVRRASRVEPGWKDSPPDEDSFEDQYSPETTEREKAAGKLPKNMALCVTCGARVRIDLDPERPKAHALTVDCLIRQTAQTMEKRGWARAGNWAGLLLRAGLPVERAPVNKTAVTWEEAPEPWKSRAKKQGLRMLVEVPEDGPWAEAKHVELAKLLRDAPLTAIARAALLKQMLADEETAAAVGAARAFDGPKALSGYGHRYTQLAADVLGAEPPRKAGSTLAHACLVNEDGPWAGDGVDE